MCVHIYAYTYKLMTMCTLIHVHYRYISKKMIGLIHVTLASQEEYSLFFLKELFD